MSKDSLATQGGSPVREKFLPYALPKTGAEEAKEMLASLESGWITTGPKVKQLETALAEYTGAKEVICVNSCTAALHLCLFALGMKPGDEVITTPLTFCSTVNTILQAGGTPVLVDVEEDTLNIDPVKIEAAITPKTRAIVPVHYAGHPCDMDAIRAIAKKHNLKIIEDAAHAIGTTYKGKQVGSLSDAACFSFYATKNITTAEGGAIATDDEELIKSARVNSLHGMSKDAWKRYTSAGSWYYEVVSPGFKYNMTDLEAALGLHQLPRLEEFITRRQELAAQFDQALSEVDEVKAPVWRKDEGRHVYHLYPIRIDLQKLSCDRAQFIEELKAENIGTTVNFIPIHYHPYYRDTLGLKPGSLPVVEAAYDALISLPLYPKMTDADGEDVMRAVRKVVEAYRR